MRDASGSGSLAARWGWPLFLLVLLGALVAYWPALHAGWIWDDDSYVTQNPVVQSPDGIWQSWVPGRTPQYYPLVFCSFWVQVAAHGVEPFGFHLVNVLLHLCSAVVLWRVLVRLGVPGAWLAAAIFALHPVQVESVAWVTERKNVLSLLCALASTWAWVRGTQDPRPLRSRSGWFGLSFVLFVAAMLSKTTAVAVPVGLAAVELWQRRSGAQRPAGQLPARGAAALVAPYLVIGVLMGLYTAHVEATHVGATGVEFHRAPLDRLLQAAQAWWFYARTWVWPGELLFVYPPFEQGGGQWMAWAALAGGVAVAGWAAWRFWQGKPGWLALFLVYSAGVFPALGFINVYPLRFAPVADHFGYVGGVAMCIGLGWLLAQAWGAVTRSSRVPPWVGAAACALLLSTLATLTWTQTLHYQDEATLWSWTLERNPRAWLAANNLATIELAATRAALESGDTSARDQHLARAAALVERAAAGAAESGVPDLPVFSNLSEVRRLQNRLPEALAAINQAVDLQPRYAGTRWQRGRLRELTGDEAGAAEDYAVAVREDPGSALYLREQIRHLVKQKRVPEARDAAARLARMEPDDPETQGNLASLMLETGDIAGARMQFERALSMAAEPLATIMAVRMADACLRAPLEPRWTARGLELGKQLVIRTEGKEPISLLLLALGQATTGDEKGARASLAVADALLEKATSEQKQVAAEVRARVMERLSGAAPTR